MRQNKSLLVICGILTTSLRKKAHFILIQYIQQNIHTKHETHNKHRYSNDELSSHILFRSINFNKPSPSLRAKRKSNYAPFSYVSRSLNIVVKSSALLLSPPLKYILEWNNSEYSNWKDRTLRGFRPSCRALFRKDVDLSSLLHKHGDFKKHGNVLVALSLLEDLLQGSWGRQRENKRRRFCCWGHVATSSIPRWTFLLC